MPNRYSSDPRFKLSDQAMRSLRRTPGLDAENRKKAEGKKFWGDVAGVGLPILGTIAGGAIGSAVGVPMVGAQLGGGLGMAAGQGVSAGMYRGAEEEMDPIRERELRRMALLQAIQGMR
jgi:hypothetical protein